MLEGHVSPGSMEAPIAGSGLGMPTTRVLVNPATIRR